MRLKEKMGYEQFEPVCLQKWHKRIVIQTIQTFQQQISKLMSVILFDRFSEFIKAFVAVLFNFWSQGI